MLRSVATRLLEEATSEEAEADIFKLKADVDIMLVESNSKSDGIDRI